MHISGVQEGTLFTERVFATNRKKEFSMKNVIATSKAPAAIGPYSQGIQAGNTVYFSGQLGIDPETGKLAEGVEAQTVQSLKNVQALLQEAGAGVQQVVKTTVYITSMDDFPVVNAVYARVFNQNPPARSCVAVKQLPMGGLVEIEAVVVL